MTEVEEIETGKIPDELKNRYISLYKLLSPIGTQVDHSPACDRHHIKVGKRSVCILMYKKSPTLWLNFHVEGQKKKNLVRYNITNKGVVDADGKMITRREIVKIVRAYKRARNL